MKKSKMCVYATVLLSFCFCGNFKNSGDRIQNFQQLQKNFKTPPVDYQTVPFWVWHDKVSRKDIDEQLRDFKKKGIGGVFIHPRYGLITEYLSDEWFDLVVYAVEQAKQLGLRVWLYDENSFPSGFAGGHVPAQMPESADQGQGLVLEKSSRYPADVNKYELVLYKQSGGFVSADRDMGKGEYYLCKKVFYGKSKWYAGFSYVDLLLPGVTEKFIQITMEGYESSIGPEIGRTVAGIFTDEPNISTPNGDAIRWTPALFEKFEQRWGYRLQENLPSLFEEIGDWKRVRHNHYALLLELFIENWSKPWHEYCEKQGFLWTGHYWEHGWPSPHHGGDNMAMYAWHQMPGIDMLFNTFSREGVQFGNARAVKELSSVANQLNRHRTLSETYGAAGWELTFQDMKRLGDWEFVLGVNFMNQHLSYMTLLGDRKHDFPQSFSYHTPWWDYYKPLADYFARLSLALSSGYQKNRILVLEPTSAAWMYYSPLKSNARLEEIGHFFRNFINELEQCGIEYDIGCENIIKDYGKIQNNKFLVGAREYDLIVFPPGLDNIDSPTLSLLKEYAKNGGAVLSFTAPPRYADGKQDSDLNDIFDRYTSTWQLTGWKNKASNDLLAEKDFTINTIEGAELLFHHRRQFDDGQLLFLVNSSMKNNARGHISIAGLSIDVLDAQSGEIRPFSCKIEKNRVNFDFDLYPVESLLLFIHPGQSSQTPEVKGGYSEKLFVASDSSINREQSNILVLDYCDLELGGTTETGLYFYTAANKIWKYFGFDDNPWVSSSQYKSEIVEKDNFSDSSGFKIFYHFIIDGEIDVSSLDAVVERPTLWQVSVNGHPVQHESGKWWLDKSFAVYKIGSLVHQGENILSLHASPMSIYAELEPVFILGDFALQSVDQGWKIVPPQPLVAGLWHKQGLPFYGFGVSYNKKFDRLNPEKKYVVKLGEWDGTVAVVYVNGTQAGIIGWPPYELDISEWMKPGENSIKVTVIGSLKNVLGPFYNVDRRGIVTPWSFKYAPEQQPPGENYDLNIYGLYENFKLLE
ncbi:hypothetical protein JW935_12865, partial [candidate division KSB1 bacterium]|nr:hypothetical protein [candidate division KSB1 bacterium]